MPVKWRTLFSEKLICLKSSVLKVESLIRAIVFDICFLAIFGIARFGTSTGVITPYSCNNSSKKPGSEFALSQIQPNKAALFLIQQ